MFPKGIKLLMYSLLVEGLVAHAMTLLLALGVVVLAIPKHKEW